MRTSAPLARRRTISRPALSFKFTHMPFLLRLTRMNRADSPSVKGPTARSQSPPGGSTLVTAAPRSPSITEHSGPATPCETSITLIPVSAKAIRPPHSGHGSRGRRASQGFRQAELTQNLLLVLPQLWRGPRDRGRVSTEPPVRPAHAARAPGGVNGLEHVIRPGLGVVVYEVGAGFVSQVKGAGHAVRPEGLFPLPRSLLFESLGEEGDQHFPVFHPLRVVHKPWVGTQLLPSERLTQPRPDAVMDRRHADVPQRGREGLV